MSVNELTAKFDETINLEKTEMRGTAFNDYDEEHLDEIIIAAYETGKKDFCIKTEIDLDIFLSSGK